MHQVVLTASNGTMSIGQNNDYYGSYTAVGGQLQQRDAAQPGDIIQFYNPSNHQDTAHVHTMIVLGHSVGSNTFSVIDQNWSPGKVLRHSFDIYAYIGQFPGWAVAIWRVGTVTSPATAPQPTVRMAFSRGDGALFRQSDSTAWQQLAGPGATSVAVDGQAMAMIVPWQGAIYRLNDSSPWTTIRDMSSHPTSVAIADNGRVAFSADDGAWFRACSSCAWQQMASAGAAHVAVDKNRMAMIVPWAGAIFRANDSSPWTVSTGYSSTPTSVAVAG